MGRSLIQALAMIFVVYLHIKNPKQMQTQKRTLHKLNIK